MRTIPLTLLLAALCGVSGVSVHGQVYAYGTQPTIIVRVDEHIWLVDGWPNGYGLVQFRSRSAEGAPWIRQTTICFGQHSFTVRLPAVLVVAVGVITPLSLAWLVVAVGNKIRRVYGHETDAT